MIVTVFSNKFTEYSQPSAENTALTYFLQVLTSSICGLAKFSLSQG